MSSHLKDMKVYLYSAIKCAVSQSVSLVYFTFLWEKLLSFPYFICSITIANLLRQIIVE